MDLPPFGTANVSLTYSQLHQPPSAATHLSPHVQLIPYHGQHQHGQDQGNIFLRPGCQIPLQHGPLAGGSSVPQSPGGSTDSTSQSLQLMENRQSATEIRLQLTQISGKLDRLVERADNGGRSLTSSIRHLSDITNNEDLLSKFIQDGERSNLKLVQKVDRVELTLENLTAMLNDTKRQLNVLHERMSIEQGKHQVQVQSRDNFVDETALVPAKAAASTHNDVNGLLTELRQSVNTEKLKVVQLEQQLESLQSKEQRSRLETASYADRLNDNEAVVQRLRDELRDERKIRMQLQNQELQLATDLSDHRQKNGNLEKIISEMKAKLNSDASNHEDEIRAVTSSFERELTSLKETIRQLRHKHEIELMEKSRELEEEMNRTWEERQSRHLARISKKHLNELKELDVDNQRLTERIGTVEQKLTAAKEREQLLTKQLEELRVRADETNDWEKKYSKLRQKALEMKSRYEGRIAETEDAVAGLKEQLADARRQTDVLTTTYEQRLAEESKLNTERIRQLTDELQDARQRLTDNAVSSISTGYDEVDEINSRPRQTTPTDGCRKRPTSSQDFSVQTDVIIERAEMSEEYVRGQTSSRQKKNFSGRLPTDENEIARLADGIRDCTVVPVSSSTLELESDDEDENEYFTASDGSSSESESSTFGSAALELPEFENIDHQQVDYEMNRGREEYSRELSTNESTTQGNSSNSSRYEDVQISRANDSPDSSTSGDISCRLQTAVDVNHIHDGDDKFGTVLVKPDGQRSPSASVVGLRHEEVGANCPCATDLAGDVDETPGNAIFGVEPAITDDTSTEASPSAANNGSEEGAEDIGNYLGSRLLIDSNGALVSEEASFSSNESDSVDDEIESADKITKHLSDVNLSADEIVTAAVTEDEGTIRDASPNVNACDALQGTNDDDQVVHHRQAEPLHRNYQLIQQLREKRPDDDDDDDRLVQPPTVTASHSTATRSQLSDEFFQFPISALIDEIADSNVAVLPTIVTDQDTDSDETSVSHQTRTLSNEELVTKSPVASPIDDMTSNCPSEPISAAEAAAANGSSKIGDVISRPVSKSIFDTDSEEDELFAAVGRSKIRL